MKNKKNPPQGLISDLVSAAAEGGIPIPAVMANVPRKAPEPNPIAYYAPARCGHPDCRSFDILKKAVINRAKMIYRVKCRACGRYSVIKPYTGGANAH